MLRAAVADVERLAALPTSREVAKAVQQAGLNATGHAPETSGTEAELVRAEARAAAAALLNDARHQAEREASELLRAARDQAIREQWQAAGELRTIGDELARQHRESVALGERLEALRARLAALTATAPEPRQTRPPEPPLHASAGPDQPAAQGSGLPDSGPGGPPASAAIRPDPVPAPAPQPPPALADGMLMGELQLILPETVDRITVEVIIAVLQDQPGVTVRQAYRDQQSVIILLLVDRPVPLVPILRELPRVVDAVYSPPNGVSDGAANGTIVLEYGDR